MQKSKRSPLFWLLLLIGIGSSVFMLYHRVAAERKAVHVACAISYDDVQLLCQTDQRSPASWLADLSAGGIHYLILTDENQAEAEPLAQAAGMEIARAGDTAKAGDAFLIPSAPPRGTKGYDIPAMPRGNKNVPLALVENYDRTGVVMPPEFNPDAWDGTMVKTLYMYDAYSYHYDPDVCENGNILFRAVTDRSMRLLVVTPLEYETGGVVADPAAYTDMLSALKERIARRGLTLGNTFSALDAPRANKILLGCSVLLPAALAVLFLCLVFPVTPLFENLMLLCSILAAAGGAFLVPGLLQKAVAFGTAVLAPCFAALMLGHICLRRETDVNRLPLPLRFIAALTALLFISLAGGLYIAALLATRLYMLEFAVFSGVKLAQLIPLAIAVLILAATLRHRPSSMRHKVPVAVIIVVILGVAAALTLLILRSGDNMIPVAKFELAARTWLEHTLYARPRTKEMLLAFPALALFLTANERQITLLEFPLGILAAVGSVSVVNTFCHIFTPVHISLIRTLLGAGIGLCLGFAGMAVFHLLLGKKQY